MSHRAEPCPVLGCIDPKARGHLMCRHHWRMVDAHLRKAVNSTWKALRDLGRDRRAIVRMLGLGVPGYAAAYAARLETIRNYRAAADAAIASLNVKEAAHAE